MTEDTEKYRAPALDKGLDILELLASTEDGLSQAEIAKALSRSPNEIYRMLDRLVRRDYIRRTTTDRYVLTLKLFELAHLTPPIRRLVSHATPVLRRFARDSQQAVHLVIHDRNVLVVVAQVDGPSYWNVSIRVGARLSMATTGSGHIFLAYASDEDRALMLENPLDPHGDRLVAGLREHLAVVAERGYEVMVSEQVASVTNLSVPVFGPLGTVIASLTSPYTPRLDVRGALDQQATLDLLVAAGHEISARSLKTS